MAQLPYVCFYLSYLESFTVLSDVARGRLTLAMLQYAATGEEPKLTKDTKSLWPTLRSQIDRDMQKYQEKCEQNRIKGAKGGRAPRKATASTGLAQEAKEKEREKDNDKDKDNEKEKEKERENDKEKDTVFSSLPPAFFPPGVEEVAQYAWQLGLSIDAAGFVDYYTANGWMVGRNPMRDWKAAVRSWHRKEITYGKTDMEPQDYALDYAYGTAL